MAKLENLVVLSPFGVFPPRSGGHAAVLEPARALAKAGVRVHLFGLGIRRFEAFRHLRSFERVLEPGLVEERHVSLWNWCDYLRRGRTGLPPLRAGGFLGRAASGTLRAKLETADAVVCEFPWLFPLASPRRPRVLVTHNVEAALVEANPRARPRHRVEAARQEKTAWQEADRVICFTEEDRQELSRRYGERPAEVIPLGVDPDRIRPPSEDERRRARRRLEVGDRFVVLFTGAWHLPNRAARDRMLSWARRSRDDLLFVVAGSVGERPERGRNWVVTGSLPSLDPWFHAADCAVNPVTEGSGANVKLLEYLAHGLAVVTTPFGARGLAAEPEEFLLVHDVESIPDALEALRREPDRVSALAAAGRRWVDRERSWTALARRRREVIEGLL